MTLFPNITDNVPETPTPVSALAATLFKLNMQCAPQVEITKESFSTTNNYSDCNEKGKFKAVYAGLSGVAVAVPDVSVNYFLDYKEMAYTSSYCMTGGPE